MKAPTGAAKAPVKSPSAPPVQAPAAALPERPGSEVQHGSDVSLGVQLAAGAAPDSPASAWMWLLFAALGFLGGQVLAAIFVAITAAAEGKLELSSRPSPS